MSREPADPNTRSSRQEISYEEYYRRQCRIVNDRREIYLRNVVLASIKYTEIVEIIKIVFQTFLTYIFGTSRREYSFVSIMRNPLAFSEFSVT